MRPAAKKYNTQYKKKIVERDPYLPLRSPKGIIQCIGCGAFYARRHWTLSPPKGFNARVHRHPVYCPACTKIRQCYPGGELQLIDVEREDRRELARILRNEEARAREKNPLERIMGLYAFDGSWRRASPSICSLSMLNPNDQLAG